MLMNKSLADYYMQKYGLKALIATQPVSLKYFSGINCWAIDWLREWMCQPGGSNSSIPLYCLLPYNAPPILILPCELAQFGFNSFSKDIRLFGSPLRISQKSEDSPFDLTKLQESDRNTIKSYIREVYSNPTEAIVKTIEEKGLDLSKIGIELKGFSEVAFKQVSEHLKNISFKDCTEIIRLTRMIKTDEEISLLTRSAELNEIAMQESAKSIKENNTFGHVFSRYKEKVEQRGGIPEHFIFSQYGCGVIDIKDYVFKNDQCILLDTGAYYSNYVSDTGTTVFTGKLEPKYCEIFKRIYESINIGLNSIKPGEKCSTVSKNMRQYLKKQNVQGADAYGHGIGLHPSEYPLILSNLNYVYNDGFEERNADFILEKNMVINLEGPVYIFGEVSYTVEVSAVVSGEGHKDLVTQNRCNPIMNY